MSYRKLNLIVGWITFAIAAFVFIGTMEPTTSLWDCGEFIATAYKLEVGHPPGAPFFMIVARFFALFAGGDVTQVALMINMMSALASAFTILFLFWTITHLAKKLISQGDEKPNLAQMIAILGSGLVGTLAYTFSDTFWFSAVEGEVYATSSLFTALVFWAMLKWENVANEKYANRWIIFIAYLMGLSIGVHLLNLLAIPAIVFVYYFKKYEVSTKAVEGFFIFFLLILLVLLIIPVPNAAKFVVFLIMAFLGWYFLKHKLHKEKGFNGMVYATIVSVIILGTIMYVIMPGIPILASKFELLFVNGLGLPIKTGVVIFLLGIIGLLIYGIYWTIKKQRVILNTILLGVIVIMIGYSSFAMIVIRSLANPPMDENNPETVFSLLAYLNREQYGDRPLFNGQHFNSPLDRNEPYKKGAPVYTPIDGRYEITDYKESPNYDSRFTTLFPRMWSSQANHVDAYKSWSDYKGKPIRFMDRNGEMKTINKPTFGENLRFFFNYQLGHMYFRYFMWNYAGRQNDIQGHGGILYGNWLSGIKFIDDARLGPQDKITDTMKNHKARNEYYLLPLLLGIIGLAYQYSKRNKQFWLVMLLFFFTGIAIVIYLNQYPYQPRERDYAYAGSFYAFAIWIGIGLLAVYDLLKRAIPSAASAGIATVLCLLLVPGIMAKENRDDHDRSGRFVARDFAYNYLNSCAPNAVIFTNGDNDTFPLWYAQEVEGIRTDVRVCCLPYLSTDWYIDQMKRKAYESDPVPFSMNEDQYRQGNRDLVPLVERFTDHVNLKQAVDFVADDNPGTKLRGYSEDEMDYLPAKKFKLPVDSAKAITTGTVKDEDADQIVDEIKFGINRNYITKNQMMILDLLANNNWERPVYFTSIRHENTLGLDNYFQLEGFAYRLVPINTPRKDGEYARIDTDILYNNLMNEFKWGRINEEDVNIDEYIRRTVLIVRIRNNFARLAKALIEEQKVDSAINVLDRCMELLPHEQIPFNYNVVPIFEAYYKAGAIEKANAVAEKLADELIQEIDFYMSLKGKFSDYVIEELQRALAIFNEVIRITEEYKQEELTTKYKEQFDQFYQSFLMNNAR